MHRHRSSGHHHHHHHGVEDDEDSAQFAAHDDDGSGTLDAAELQRLRVLLDHLFESGFMVINTCSATLSTAMGEAEVDAFVAALGEGFEKLVASMGSGHGE